MRHGHSLPRSPQELAPQFDVSAPLTRRGFLRVAACASTTLSMLDGAAALATPTRETRYPLIVLFLSGGVSAKESFNPDPLAQRNGCAVPPELRGPLGSIATRTGNRYSEVFPKLADRSNRYALIRSLDAGTSEHTQGQQHAILRGRTTLNEQIGERASDGGVGYVLLNPGSSWEGLRMAFHESSAFTPDWDEGTQSFRPPTSAERTPEERARLTDRNQLLGSLNAHSSMSSTPQTQRMDRFQQTAYDLARGGGELLRATQLQKGDRLRYGDGTKPTLAGDMALMARQFVERGAGSVTVYYEPESLTFDLHSNIADGMRTHGHAIDAAAAALIDDIGRSTREYVVYIVGEMNRTPRINGRAGRDHWRHGNCAILAGGKTRRGVVVGETDTLGRITRDPVQQREQLTNTVFGACGFPVAATAPQVRAILES